MSNKYRRLVMFLFCYTNCITYNDRLPLEVDVVDAHHLVGRKRSDRINVNMRSKSEQYALLVM